MIDGDVPLEGSLQELLATPSLKWIFVGGKGGVGKTTTSCALAVKLAETRESVLLLSTDPAHNLGDAFAQKFSATPSLVNGFSNLYAMEIDSRRTETSGFKLPDSEGMLDVFPQILQAVPGIDEALSFAELMRSVQTFSYSVIVFDTAPTGHTLRLLSFPSLVEKALSKLAAIKGNLSAAVGLLGAFSSRGTSVNADDAQKDEGSCKFAAIARRSSCFRLTQISSTIDHVRAVTTSVRETFQDPTKTTFVCVCIPEFLSVYETERLVQELAKQQIDCSNIVVNHVLFPVGKDEALPAEEPPHLRDGQPSPFSTLMADPKKVEASDGKSREEKLEDLALRLQKRLFLVEKIHNSRRRMQSKYLQQIQDLYSFDFHVVCMAQQSAEVRGRDKLEAFAALLCEERPLPIMKAA